MIPFHKVVIIGAGISGLTAAVYLQRSGFQTLVLEKAGGPGGVSTSWKRKGYTFEGGVHWLIGAKKEIPLHQVWKETGALQENNPVYFKDPIYTLVDSEGTMPLFRDLHGLETKGLRDRIALWSLRFHLACFKHFHQPIGDLRGLKVRHPKPFSIGEYAKMLPAVLLTPFLMAQSARGYAKRFKNKRIRSLLAAVVEPDINALSLIYTLGTFQVGDSGYPQGGSLRMAQNMAETFLNLAEKFVTRQRWRRSFPLKTDGLSAPKARCSRPMPWSSPPMPAPPSTSSSASSCRTAGQGRCAMDSGRRIEWAKAAFGCW